MYKQKLICCRIATNNNKWKAEAWLILKAPQYKDIIHKIKLKIRKFYQACYQCRLLKAEGHFQRDDWSTSGWSLAPPLTSVLHLAFHRGIDQSAAHTPSRHPPTKPKIAILQGVTALQLLKSKFIPTLRTENL